MRTARRLVEDEAGMTMALAIIMILLLGVMGAGLLTFVGRDLNVVVEENRGQRAFEVADAGIEAAKRQLASNVVIGDYDGEEPDIQWSSLNDGLILDNLDGVGSTADRATVTIEYRDGTDDFLVISTGTYGDPPRQAKRKIEATFAGVDPGSGGNELGHPLYFTPSSISIDGPNVTVDGISMFAGGDLLIEGVTNRDGFLSEYRSAAGTLKPRLDTGNNEELCDWDTDTPPDRTNPNPNTWDCYMDEKGNDLTGNWNTQGRTMTGTTTPYQKVGFAAEEVICSFPSDTVPSGNCGSSASVADGMYGYDSTTGDRGNHLTFVDKEDPAILGPGGSDEPNPSGTISYPFPRPTPIPEELARVADAQGRYKTHDPVTSPADWSTLFNGTAGPGREKVVFVDARNNTLPFSTDNSAKNSGILVVWCGRLEMNQNFNGIVLSLQGPGFTVKRSNGTTFAVPGCGNSLPGQQNVGTYRSNGIQCQCWTYAQGGTLSRAGLELGPNSTVKFLPSGNWSFYNSAFEGPPPTSFALRNWRELYE